MLNGSVDYLRDEIHFLNPDDEFGNIFNAVIDYEDLNKYHPRTIGNGGTVGPVVTRLLAMQKVSGSNPTIDKNLYSFFDCKYFNGLLSGVLVLTQHLNGKYCVSSRPSDERHTTGWACYDTGHMRLM
ncbi:hypothetical protein M8J77_004250 [Diaphorina citri]|nr:hypothetical protein M8J77_004250 [Diaphorina citri]